jgi:DNA-binding response OmpR family regulator
MLGKNAWNSESSPERSDPEGDIYDDGFLHVEHDGYYVACAGKPIFNLSRKEFLILSRLVRGNGRVVTKEEVWTSTWGNTEFNYNTFRVHIASLRRKISQFGLDIVTVVHVGYRIARSEVQNDQSQSKRNK